MLDFLLSLRTDFKSVRYNSNNFQKFQEKSFKVLLTIEMDSEGSSRRSSACSTTSGFDGIDTCGLEDEQVREVRFLMN